MLFSTCPILMFLCLPVKYTEVYLLIQGKIGVIVAPFQISNLTEKDSVYCALFYSGKITIELQTHSTVLNLLYQRHIQFCKNHISKRHSFGEVNIHIVHNSYFSSSHLTCNLHRLYRTGIDLLTAFCKWQGAIKLLVQSFTIFSYFVAVTTGLDQYLTLY